MKISKLISLMLCIFVLSCTTNDQEEVLVPQEPNVAPQKSKLDFQKADFAISEEEAKLLDKFFIELQNNPDYFDQSIEEQMTFIATFASQNGHNVDLKDYNQYLHTDNQSRTELGLTKELDNYIYEIDNYVLQAGMSDILPSKLSELEKNIITSSTLTEEERFIVKSDIALWKHLSTNNSFTELYREREELENSRGFIDYAKCIYYNTKFGVNFLLCIKGKFSSCTKLPSDAFNVLDACKKIFKKKFSSSRPLCRKHRSVLWGNLYYWELL